MNDILEKYSITLYSTENEEKGSLIERFNTTLKEKIYKDFTRKGNTIWTDNLSKLIENI